MANSRYISEDNVFVRTILSIYNVLVHILMGMIVGIALLFAIKMNFNVSSVPDNIILLHILLCVPGFILIMSQSLLALTTYNTWTSSLNITVRKRIHWILQSIGSLMGLTGCIAIMVYKDVNFDTFHGRFGLVTLILITTNLFFGVANVFSFQMRRLIPPIVTKIIHIILGIGAYISAITCLCYAFNKDIFIIWTSAGASGGIITVTAVFTLIILISPLITLFKKFIESINTRCGTR